MLQHVPPVPWRNGQGLTQVLVDEPLVRVSIATLKGQTSFSRFEGLHRLFVVLKGRVVLTIDGVEHRLQMGERMAFHGEQSVHASCTGLVLALNIMASSPPKGAVTLRRELKANERGVVTEGDLLGALVCGPHVLDQAVPCVVFSEDAGSHQRGREPVEGS